MHFICKISISVDQSFHFLLHSIYSVRLLKELVSYHSAKLKTFYTPYMVMFLSFFQEIVHYQQEVKYPPVTVSMELKEMDVNCAKNTSRNQIVTVVSITMLGMIMMNVVYCVSMDTLRKKVRPWNICIYRKSIHFKFHRI